MQFGGAASRRGRAALWVAGALAVYLVGSFVGGGWFMATNVARRPYVVRSQPSHLADRARAIELRTEDGVRLSGYYAPPRAGRPVLMMQHGKGRTRDAPLPHARIFAHAGYGVLAFDWRGHGSSDGDVIFHGAQERKDVRAALAFLDREAPEVPVGVIGTSMGGAIVALSADLYPPRVRCMVLDSPYGDLGRMVDDRLSALGPLAFGPRLGVAVVGQQMMGAPLSAIKPELALAAFAPRPVFFMHGDADGVIPVSEGRSLHEKYPGEKQYWEIPGLKHCRVRETQTREFMRRVAGFLAAHLPGAPGVEAVLRWTPEAVPSGSKLYEEGGTALQVVDEALAKAAEAAAEVVAGS